MNVTSNRIYLDNAAATPVRLEVLQEMLPYFSSVYGNAGAVHREGVEARVAIDTARLELARILHIRPEGVVFTGSGTESNNLALLGTLQKLRKEGVAYTDMEILTTRIEHPSILEVCAHARSLGVLVNYIDVNESGMLEIRSLQELLSSKTVLVTCAYANSEVGVIQPLGKIARIIREYEATHETKIVFHVDAAQAPLWLPCALDMLLADSVALDAGKCGGPKGVGVLAFGHTISFEPYLFGGGQEFGLRSGTENTALIVGAVAAIRIAQATFKERAEYVQRLRDQFILKLLMIDGVMLNGSPTERIANNVNISVLGMDSEFIAITLDEQGIACSTKSACGGAKGEGSGVVRAMTGDEARARSTVRFSLGEQTTLEELDTVASHLKDHIHTTRDILQKLTVN